jgi:alginate O-acetyltransferase complex protein AlgI
MLFNSLAFVAFLPIVLAGYYALSPRGQNLWLLLASCIFYGWWDYRFLALLAVAAFTDFFAALLIERTDSPRRRKLYLLASLTMNLGTLAFFKYFNFFLDSAYAGLAALGLEPARAALDIVLPVGISFYTFQALSYTIDVYKGELRACHDPITYGLYITYFPQLVAGPIERATALMPQLTSPRRVGWRDLREGALLCLIGYFKKVGVADALAPLVDVRFQNASAAGGLDLLIGLYLFSFQIYCDFSGYSDIARGVSRFFGIRLMENFRQPYFSRSITEFWRRWHISLSTWLRDYLYITLGGNRGGRAKTYRNLMLTMLLGGLWHGASWNFVIWGGLHGLYLAIHKIMLERRGETKPVGKEPWLLSLGKMVLTFHLVALTWIFFRAGSFAIAWSYLSRILTWGSPTAYFFTWYDLWAGVLVLALLGLDLFHERRSQAGLLALPWVVRGLCYAALVTLILVFGGLDAEVPFIYFQF